MRLIIFDLDGTLLDSAPDLCASMNYVLSKAGKPTIEYQKCRILIGNGIKALVKEGLQFDGSKVEADELEHWMQIYYDHYRSTMTDTSVLYSGCTDILQWLRNQGYALAICTNKYLSLTKPLLKHYQLDSYFDLVVGGDSVEQKKPHPQAVEYCCKQLSIETNQALMVGDSINDIQAAKAAGVISVLITYGYRTQTIEELAPEHVIDSLGQIPEVLQHYLQPQ